jgi:hypothetical protein
VVEHKVARRAHRRARAWQGSLLAASAVAALAAAPAWGHHDGVLAPDSVVVSGSVFRAQPGAGTHVSGSGDQGADPNQVVAITDQLGASDPSVANYESFRTVAPARFGVRYGGVAVLPRDFGASDRGW